MKPVAVLVYLTTSGNTRAAAEALAERMAEWAEVSVVPVARVESDPGLLDGSAIVGFGGPVFHLRMADRVTRFVERLRGDRRRSCFLFCTYAGISSGLSLLTSARSLAHAGHTILGALKLKAPHFYQSGSEFPDREALAALSRFSALLCRRWASPPAQQELIEELDYQRPLVKVLHKIIPAFSSRRVPAIELAPERCRGCGVCAKRCPAGAIRIANRRPVFSRAECMHCYSCVSTCRFGALDFDEQKLRRIVAFNKRVLGEERPATAFI